MSPVEKPSATAAATPSAKDPAKSIVKPAPKPVAKPTAKSGAGPTAKSGAGPAAKSAAKPVAKSGAGPAAKSAAKPVANSGARPVANLGARPVAKSGAKPVAKSIAKPAAESSVKPVAKSIAKPVAKSGAKSAAESSVKPVAKSGARPVAKSGARPVAKSGAKPAAESSVKPVAKSGARPVAKSGAKSAAESSVKSVAKPGAGPAAKSAAKPGAGEPPGRRDRDRRLLRRILPYLKPYRRLVAFGVLLVIGGSGAALAGPYLTKIAIDDYIAEGDLGGLWLILGLYAAVLAVGFVAAYGQAWIVNLFGQRVMRDIRRDVFNHIQKLHVGWFDRNPVGQVVTRATSDVDALNELLSSGVVMIITDVVLLVGIMAALLLMNWQLALVTFAAVPALFVSGWIFRRKIRPAFRRVRAAVAAANSFIQESITGMQVLQLYRQERRRARDYRVLNREHAGAHLDTVFCFSVFYPVVEMITAVSIVFIIGYGGSLIGGGAVEIGGLVAFIMYSEMFFRPIRDLTEKFNILQGAMAASERIVGLLDTEPEIASPPKSLVPANRLGAFAFQDVSFAYSGEDWVLRDVSLDVSPGETVALVGATGSGKTTLAALLLRLYQAQRGRVLVDGVDVREWDLPELRRTFSMVQQDVHLFSGSVLDNIRLGDPALTEERAAEAAEAAGVSAWADRLPDGLRTPLGERGGGLSQGQRQLVGIARAMARDSRVLVLDEATSSVDTETERLVQAALARVLENRTSLVIAHRLSTVRGADRIVVLHRGRICESGSHEELLAKAGIYRRLYELQFAEEAALAA